MKSLDDRCPPGVLRFDPTMADDNEQLITPQDVQEVSSDLTLRELRLLLPSDKKRAFLAAFAVTGIRSKACRAAGGVSLASVKTWYQNDPIFARAYELARDVANDALEEEAHRRGVEGVVREVYGKLPGKDSGVGVVGTEMVYSDTMLAMLLNGNLPNKYRRNISVSGPDGGPIQIEPVTQRLAARLQEIAERRTRGQAIEAAPCPPPLTE